jgi:hypoxanthine phosphoribosyltransferase
MGMTEEVKVLIPEEEVSNRIKELAEQINADYKGRSIHLICILKGSVVFCCDLAKRITIPVTFDFMSVSSYAGETVSSGRVKISKDLDDSIQGKDVLIIEDIIDSGRTLAYLKTFLNSRGPGSMAICTLLDKPERREVPVDVKYVGFKIPDKFVVGYGLDYDQHYRNLPYVGFVE